MAIDDKGASVKRAEIQSRRGDLWANAFDLLQKGQGLLNIQIDKKIETDLAVAGANFPQGSFQFRRLLFRKGDIADQRFNVGYWASATASQSGNA